MSTQTQAADDGLYASAPPPGSAFVRFVNGDASQSSKGNVRGKDFSTVAPGQAGAYVPISQGDGTVIFGGATSNYNFKPGGRYSIIFANKQLNVVEEPVNNNKLKTQLILINASNEKEVSLRTSDGKTSVIESVDPNKVGTRPVNPVKTGFAVYAGSEKIANLDEQTLERGASYAIVVYDSAKGPVANYTKATGS